MLALKGALSAVPLILLMAAVLLLTPGVAAGVWAWPTAWGFLAAFGTATACANALLAALRPASYQVRRQGLVAPAARTQPLIDRIGTPAYVILIQAWLAFIPLDVFRLQLLPAPPALAQALGAVMALAGLAVAYVAVGQNRFAAPTIHDQSAEGQRVIQTGLYGVVRHPFYAGMLLVYPGVALWLGSWAAAIACVAFLGLTLVRIVIEERWLREHLPDYAAYAQRVRARLIPAVL